MTIESENQLQEISFSETGIFGQLLTRRNREIRADMHLHSIHSKVKRKLSEYTVYLPADDSLSLSNAINTVCKPLMSKLLHHLIRNREYKYNGLRPVDSLMSVKVLVHMLKLRGINVFALTDHDTVEGLPEAKYWAEKLGGITFIPGTEITVQYENGDGIKVLHVLFYGIEEVPEGDTLEEVISAARSINPTVKVVAAHPFDRDGWPDKYLNKEKLRELGVDAIEIYNSASPENITSFEDYRDLVKKLGIPIITVGSDGHDPIFSGTARIALPQVYNEELTAEAYLDMLFNPKLKKEVVMSSFPFIWRKRIETLSIGIRQIAANSLCQAAGALIRILANLKTNDLTFRDLTRTNGGT